MDELTKTFAERQFRLHGFANRSRVALWQRVGSAEFLSAPENRAILGIR